MARSSSRNACSGVFGPRVQPAATVNTSAIMPMRIAQALAKGVASVHVRAPADLGDARSLATRGAELDDNHYVTISGQAERRYALYVEPKGVRARQTIFRILGVPQGLFVVGVDAGDRVDLTERWSGRLR